MTYIGYLFAFVAAIATYASLSSFGALAAVPALGVMIAVLVPVSRKLT